MLGRSFLTASGVAFLVAIWAGCGGESKSIPSADGDDDDTSNTEADAGKKDKPKDPSDDDDGDDDDAPPDDKLPPAVDITYGACEDFEACGGDIVGTWNVTGGCVSDATFADLKQGDCTDAQESDVVIKAAGVVTATATKITRNLKVDITAKVAVPPACAEQGGGECSVVALGLTTDLTGNGPAFDKATCTDDGADGCNCTVSKTFKQNTTVDYTIEADTITTEDQTLGFCVAGKKLTYQEMTAETSVPITVELTKK